MSRRGVPRAAFLTAVAECFDAEAREEGTRLAQRGLVHSLGGDAAYAEAIVLDSPARRVWVGVREGMFEASCDCPQRARGVFCKHLWALIVRGIAKGTWAAWAPPRVQQFLHREPTMELDGGMSVGVRAVVLMVVMAGPTPFADAQEEPPAAPVLRKTLGEARSFVAPRPFESVAWSPSSARLAATSADGRLRVWDVASRRVLLNVPVESRVTGLLIPDEKNVLTVHGDTRLRVWEVEGGPGPKAEIGVDGRPDGRLWLARAENPEEVLVGGPSLRRLNWRTGDIRADYSLPQPAAPMTALASEGGRHFTAHGGEILCSGTRRPPGRSAAWATSPGRSRFLPPAGGW